MYDKKPSAIRSFGHRVEEDLSAVCPQLDLIISPDESRGYIGFRSVAPP